MIFACTHEKKANPRFVGVEFLEIRVYARKGE